MENTNTAEKNIPLHERLKIHIDMSYFNQINFDEDNDIVKKCNKPIPFLTEIIFLLASRVMNKKQIPFNNIDEEMEVAKATKELHNLGNTADISMLLGIIPEIKKYDEKINDFDKVSAINACRIASLFHSCDTYIPTQNGIERIITLSKRYSSFLEKYGPITPLGLAAKSKKNINFSHSKDYFLTNDTLWDIIILEYPYLELIASRLLEYWINERNSQNPEFEKITKIGIFNPIFNEAYLLDIEKIPADVIKNINTYD